MNVEKNFYVSMIDQLNLKVELKKNSLAKKIENLAEIDVRKKYGFLIINLQSMELISVISDFIERKLILVYSK